MAQRFKMTDQEKQARAYSEDRLKLARAEVDFYPAIKWMTIENPTVCDLGKCMHGKHFSTSDGLWPKCLPPLHPGCACRIVPIMEDRVKNIEVLSDYLA